MHTYTLTHSLPHPHHHHRQRNSSTTTRSSVWLYILHHKQAHQVHTKEVTLSTMANKPKTNPQPRSDSGMSAEESHPHTNSHKSLQSASVTMTKANCSRSKPHSSGGRSSKACTRENSINSEWQYLKDKESRRKSTQCRGHTKSTTTKRALSNYGETIRNLSKASNCSGLENRTGKVSTKSNHIAFEPDLKLSTRPACKPVLGYQGKSGSLIRGDRDLEIKIGGKARHGGTVCKGVKSASCNQQLSQNGVRIANYVNVNGNIIFNSKR